MHFTARWVHGPGKWDCRFMFPRYSEDDEGGMFEDAPCRCERERGLLICVLVEP